MLKLRIINIRQMEILAIRFLLLCKDNFIKINLIYFNLSSVLVIWETTGLRVLGTKITKTEITSSSIIVMPEWGHWIKIAQIFQDLLLAFLYSLKSTKLPKWVKTQRTPYSSVSMPRWYKFNKSFQISNRQQGRSGGGKIVRERRSERVLSWHSVFYIWQEVGPMKS